MDPQNENKWYDMIWYMIWYDMIWYDIWYDIIYDMIWYDMIWYDMIWYDMIYDICLWNLLIVKKVCIHIKQLHVSTDMQSSSGCTLLQVSGLILCQYLINHSLQEESNTTETIQYPTTVLKSF